MGNSGDRGDSSEIQALLNLHPCEEVFDSARSFSSLSLVSSSTFVVGASTSSASRRPAGRPSRAPAGLVHRFRLDDGKDKKKKKKKKRQNDSGSASAATTTSSAASDAVTTPSKSPPTQHAFETKTEESVHTWSSPVVDSAVQQQDESSWNSVVLYGGVGRKLDPFAALPNFTSPSVAHTERMLFDFIGKYGHLHASKVWEGAMFADRVACLSFVNIAVMAMHRHLPRGPPPIEYLTARFETIRMLNDSLRNSSNQTSNSTLMSLNHMLVSELCTADRETIEMHVRGSERAIMVRGGFELMDRTGMLERECAARNQYSILVACVMFEIPPSAGVLSYTPSTVPNLFSHFAFTVVESPVYHDEDAPTLPDFLGHQPPQLILILLGARMLTDLILQEIDFVEFGGSGAQPRTGHRLDNEEMNAIFADLLGMPSARTPGLDVTGNTMYEAVRLATLIWATAIVCNVPLSRASQMPPLRVKEPDLLQHLTDLFRQLADSPLFDTYPGCGVWATLVAAAACGPVEFIQDTCVDPATGTFKPFMMKFWEAFYSPNHIPIVRSMKTLCRVQSALAHGMSNVTGQGMPFSPGGSFPNLHQMRTSNARPPSFRPEHSMSSSHEDFGAGTSPEYVSSEYLSSEYMSSEHTRGTSASKSP